MATNTNILTLIMSTDEQFLKELGERIRALRKAHDMTQGDLADKLGVTQSLVACYETARRSIPLRKLIALAEAFDISVEEVVGKNEPTPKRRRKRGPISKLEERLIELEKLPRSEQQFVIKMLDNALANSA